MLLSLVLYCNSEYEDDGIIEKKINEVNHFGDKMEILFLDSTGKNKDKVVNKNNVKYIDVKDKSKEDAYNYVIKKGILKGEYVIFSIVDCSYDKKSLKKVLKYANSKKYKVFTMTPYYYDASGNEKSNSYRKNVDIENPVEDVINRNNIFLPAYVIHKDLVNKSEFEDKDAFYNDVNYIINIMKKVAMTIELDAKVVSDEPLETDFYNYEKQFEKEWYTDNIRNFIIPILQANKDSKYVQNVMFYLLQIKFLCNMNDRHKNILDKAEIDEFFSAVYDAIQYIDEDVMSNYTIDGKRLSPKFLYYQFVEYKNKDNMDNFRLALNQTNMVEAVIERNHNVNVVTVDNMKNVEVNVQAINANGNQLVFDAELCNVYYENFDNIKVYALVNGKRIDAVRTDVYSLCKYFGRTIKTGYTFALSIDYKDIEKDKSNIKFYVEMMGQTLEPAMKFIKIQARLMCNYRYTYWNFDDKTLTYDYMARSFKVLHRTAGRTFKNEMLMVANIIKSKKLSPISVKCIVMRLLYWITRPIYKNKEIWLTFDQLFKGGDNGEYYYRHVASKKNKNNIKMYYIINKTAPEYKRLKKKYKTVLKYNSIKHKLISLHSKVIFATRVDVKLYCGYWAGNEKFIRNLYNPEIVCLQHGLTIQKIAQYQNRLFDNTKLYFCVSPNEVKNLQHRVYGYTNDELKKTGAPRYDGLVNNDQRFILITPTWRRNVTAGTNKKGSMHEYSINFKHTEYFKVYNSLISDPKLIETAKRCNYRIVYLLHPILSPQIGDYDVNENVEILAGAGDLSYEKILTEASLMVTDYSGIQFDFAYMRKPIVYYHCDNLPPQYDEGGLDYEKESIGMVCKTHEQVVDGICKYMENECKLEQEYIDRINKFFYYDDLNNCERVYQEAVKYRKKYIKGEV